MCNGVRLESIHLPIVAPEEARETAALPGLGGLNWASNALKPNNFNAFQLAFNGFNMI